MSKIFFNGTVVWDRDCLPTERQARILLRRYADFVTDEMGEALSAGIDLKTPEGYFRVELPSDKKLIGA